MITVEQAEVIRAVWKKFNEFEVLAWTSLDDNMEFLAWISDKQLIAEAEVVIKKHETGNARCVKNHPKEECVVPVIIESIRYIADDFKENDRLAKKSRYVIEFYLSLSQTGVIISD